MTKKKKKREREKNGDNRSYNPLVDIAFDKSQEAAILLEVNNHSKPDFFNKD